MGKHNPRTEGARSVADFLNARHNTDLNEEDLIGALESLGLGLVTTTDTQSVTEANIDNAGNSLVCLDGPIGCNGDVTTVPGARHSRCEQHWSLFFESEGM